MTVTLERKRLNLALQGGGAHGAFTWGALDRLLEEPRLEIDGISGTSAGAMNAAMVKSGWLDNRHQGARAQLDRFWFSIRDKAKLNINPLADWLAAAAGAESRHIGSPLPDPLFQVQEAVTRSVSPYQWNPFNFNPLRDLLNELIDFDSVCQSCAPYLFVSATNVRTGRIKVFAQEELTVEAFLASACLPLLFQAVEIGEDAYWDGGYMGNPALFPLYDGTDTRDIAIIHINPIERADIPRTAEEILDRMNEVSFNSTLLRELRGLDMLRQKVRDGKLEAKDLDDVHLHSIRNDPVMADLSIASKVAPDPGVLDYLKAQGRVAADAFLTNHWSKIGQASSADFSAMYAD